MLTTQPIKIDLERAGLLHPGAGAWNIFAGTVRNTNYQKPVSHLEYEAFESLAEKMMAETVADARKKFRLLHASCIHRIGKVEIGEIAVLIITASPHRDAAYLGNSHILEAVKQNVPIWKKEYWEDGNYNWGSCTCHPL